MITEKVLILDSNTNSARAVIQSLTKAKYEIIKLDIEKDEQYAQLIINFLKQKKSEGISFITVIPCTDESLIPLINIEDEIRLLTRFPFPRKESILRSQDKQELLELGKQVGLLAPKTIEVTFSNNTKSVENKFEEIYNLNLPIILKPKRSVQDCSFGHNFKPERFIIKNKNDLKDTFDKLANSNTEYLAQPYINGHGIGYFCLFRDNESVLDFTHNRILEKPPEGGVSVLCTSAKPDTSIQKKVHELLSLLEWDGVAMVEFRTDENNNLYLMEINPRFWGSLQLAINCGYDFPLYLVNKDLKVDKSKFKNGFYVWPKGLFDYILIRLKRFILN